MHYQEKFFENLASLSNDPDNFLEEWVYAGGDCGRHAKYFLKRCGNEQAPPHESYCICGHDIEENCYLQNTISGELVVVGNCCIKRYIPENQAGRTCTDCRQPHKSRKDNFCKGCREKKRWACSGCNQRRETIKQEICNACQTKKKWACRNCNGPRENLNDKVCQACNTLLYWNADYTTYCRKCNQPCENYNLSLCNTHHEEEEKLVALCREQFKNYYPQSEASGLKQIRIGKHSGRTYEWVYENDPGYVNWALRTNITGELKDFQTWCLKQKAEVGDNLC